MREGRSYGVDQLDRFHSLSVAPTGIYSYEKAMSTRLSLVRSLMLVWSSWVT